MVAITEEKLNEMFDHYIDLEAKERQESHGYPANVRKRNDG